VRWIGRTLREAAGEAHGREAAFLSHVLDSRDGTAAAAVAGTATGLPNAGRPSMASVHVHCPACGRALTPVAQPLPFAVTCDGCDGRISVRGDGPGRMSMVIDATGKGQEARRDEA
jgi:hypothetical protein